MKKKIISIMLAAAMAFSLAACGGGTDSSKSNEEKAKEVELDVQKEIDTSRPLSSNAEKAEKVVVALNSDPTDLTPQNPNSTGKNEVLPEIYEALFDVIDGEYVPILAESYTEVDELHWNVKIRENIYDSEGNHITASDVVYSYNWLIETGNYQKYDLFGGIKQVDDYTVEFTWTSNPAVLSGLDMIWCRTYIFSEAAYNAHNFATDPIGTGPYVVSSFTSGSSVILEANENYWQTDESQIGEMHTANVQTIEYRIIKEAAQRVIALETGNVNYAEQVDENSIDEFLEGGTYAEDYEVYTVYDNRTYFTMFNQDDGKIGNDINFRLACYYAINNEGLAEALGFAAPAVTLGNPYYLDYQTKWESDENYMTTYDLDLAKEYLEKTDYNGETLQLIVVNLEIAENIAQLIQNMLLNAGINVEITSYEQATLDSKMGDPAEWDMAVYRCGHDAYVAGAWNICMNKEGRESGKTINFINDDILQEKYELVSSLDGHTEDNLDDMQQYWIDNAYYCGLAAVFNRTVYSNNIAALYVTGSGAMIPGACTYYLD